MNHVFFSANCFISTEGRKKKASLDPESHTYWLVSTPVSSWSPTERLLPFPFCFFGVELRSTSAVRLPAPASPGHCRRERYFASDRGTSSSGSSHTSQSYRCTRLQLGQKYLKIIRLAFGEKHNAPTVRESSHGRHGKQDWAVSCSTGGRAGCCVCGLLKCWQTLRKKSGHTENMETFSFPPPPPPPPTPPLTQCVKAFCEDRKVDRPCRK